MRHPDRGWAGYKVAMSERPIQEPKQVTISRIVMPGQTNRHGSLFGGVAMSLMDEAAGIVATRAARGPVVTAHIEAIDFKAPVWQGEAVHVSARLGRVGTSSLRVHVSTKGEDMETGEVRDCTEAEFVMVAIDHLGRPRSVPKDNADAKPKRQRKRPKA